MIRAVKKIVKYLESTLNWHWKYYIVPVDFRLSENAFIENHLSLPDGISVRSDDRFCKEFDSFRISPDGTVTDIFRSDEFKFYEY